MLTAAQLIEEVADIVQDDSYDETVILAKLNQGLEFVASRVLLPALDSTSQATTVAGNHQAPLPVDFMRNLYAASHADEPLRHRGIVVAASLGQLRREFDADLTASGDFVRMVCIAGRQLFGYQPIPAAPVNLLVSYYRKPAALVDMADLPDCLPDGFDDILIHYACWKIFDRIEDGIEGQKVNTINHRQQFAELLADLDRLSRQGQSRPPATVVRGAFL